MSTIKRRILLVENDPDLLRAVARRLRIAGYLVLPAATIDVAQRFLCEEIIHLAIIDIRVTNDRSETDRSGFAFARALPAHIPFLFHTAHDTKEHIREALGAIGADDIIAKEDPDGPAKLLASVARLFVERVAINFGLVITTSLLLTELAERIGLSPKRGDAPAEKHSAATNRDGADDETAPPPTGEDIDLLLRRLLPEALTVDLAPLLSSDLQRSHSHSGAVLLRAHETRHEGRPVPLVLKLGPTAMIRDEAERYHHLQPYLGGQRLARLEGEAYSRQVGGLLYTLVGAQDWEAIDALAAHVRQDSSLVLQEIIGRFLRQTFGAIYQEAQPAILDLTAHYTTELGLTVAKLQQALAEWRPAMLTAQELDVCEITQSVPNPVTWALCNGHFRRWGLVETYTVLCHGDLHSRNILVDGEGHCWLIDFGRAGRSHIVRDFVELEVDLRLQLLAGAEPKDIAALEQALSTQPFDAQPDPNEKFPAPLQKAHQLICTVRQSAMTLTAGRLQRSEYEQALFWHLLNAIRLRGMSAEKKAYALLAAGLLTEVIADP